MAFTAELVGQLDLLGDWGILTTDADLAITGWNRWMDRQVGRSAESLRGKAVFDTFPSLVARKLDQYYRQALEGRTVLLAQRFHKYLLPLPPAAVDARFEFMQQTARIMPLLDGAKVCGTVSLIEDVTERVEYETELRERVDALREADRRKDEFLAMLAHELRNPLAPISNAAQLLRLAGHEESIRANAHHMIERQVSHLIRLVDDLLDVSRVSRGKITLQKMSVDLAAVVQHAVETSRPLIDSRRHQLETTLPGDRVRVEGDFVRLAQVVSNLLNNAAKYTDEGGRIRLSLETTPAGADDAGEAVITVRDDGRGIDASALSSLFDLFYQAAHNIDRAEGGLGIGLSLVRSLVELHGGSVEARSRGQGQGSEFIVRLPLMPASSGNDAWQASVATAPTPSARILVVDDNRDSAESMAQLLKLDGHDVQTATDGIEAVEMAESSKPDAILLDIGLPRLNGYMACKAMREKGLTNAFIVAMTGYGQDEDRIRSQKAYFDAHLVKPIDLKALGTMLTRELASRRTRP
jgi:signal transduction histidine kinase/ActR/RegA family two-component response regulator